MSERIIPLGVRGYR